MKLYEIDALIQEVILDGVDRETGEMSEDVFAKLTELDMDRDAKCLAVLAYAKGEQAEGDAIRAYGESIEEKAKQHYARAKSHDRRAERLLDYIRSYFPTDHEKIEDARGALSWQKNPPGCEVVDEDAVPDSFTVVVPETTRPDAKAIIENWKKTGKQVPGTYVQQKKRLVVK